MFKNSISTILVFHFSFYVGFGKTDITNPIISRLEKIETRMDQIDSKHQIDLNELNNKFEFQQTIIEQSNNGISNQLSSASNNLSIFGLLFGLGAIFLGWFISRIEKKVIKISQENNELLSKNQKIKEEVFELNDLIHKDINGLYLKLKREETVNILDRLILVPDDIENVCSILLSRDLEPEDFNKLKQAYQKLKKVYRSHFGYYLLFFQHFLIETMKDDTLRSKFSSKISYVIDYSFENDILKSIKEFTILILEKGFEEYKLEINSFFSGLSNSNFKNFSPVYECLFESLYTRENRFSLFSTITSSNESKISKIEYGKLLLIYENDNPTESEKLVYSELNSLKSQN